MTRKNLQHLQITKSAVAVEQSTEADLQNLFSSFGAGFPPFLRGISTTMYVSEPWKMRQETVFSNLKDWNLFLQNNTQAIEITLETTNNLIQNVDDLFELFA